jgi:uncharacterized membrane protein YidH (DUF202 family)
MKIAGIVLIVVGIIALAYGGFRWTTREKVVDLGPVEVTSQKHQSVPIPPIAGAACLVAGVALVISGRRG